ncbi:HIT domain-containing protein [Ornithinimicrobium sufpigmenti]|uniref:HIT domain-containing protein n=1 Tax=Ornithinimicrobium sufpigmenti TaxID=2508882 RepID=UPI003CE45DE9
MLVSRSYSGQSVPNTSTSTTPGSCIFCTRRPIRHLGEVGVWPHEDSAVRSWMIAPLRHVTEFEALLDADILSIHAALREVHREWNAAERGVGTNVVWNLGGLAGQSVEHVHCHVLQRAADGPLPGYGLRWWIKKDMRGGFLLRAYARLNPQVPPVRGS